MSRLLELRCRIARLPELQKQKQNNQKLAHFAQRIQEVCEHLKECLRQRQCALIVFPNAVATRTKQAVNQTKKAAALMLETLQADFDAIGADETERKVTRIRERTQEAKDQLNKEWRRCSEESFKTLMPLIEIVRSIPGNEGIVDNYVATQILAATIPDCVDSAIKLQERFEQLRATLGHLNLEGPGGQFLKRAVHGRASARDLLDNAVQEFLEVHGLWEILTIRVGR